MLASASVTALLESISQNNFFWSSVEILLGAIAMFIASKRGIKEWKAAAAIGVLGISISILAILCSRMSMSFSNLAGQLLPIFAVTAWMLSASYFRHRVTQSVIAQDISLKHAIATQGDAFKEAREKLEAEIGQKVLIDISDVRGEVAFMSLQFEDIKRLVKIENILDGVLVRGMTDSIYKVEGGKLRWIVSKDVFNRYGFKAEDVWHLPELIIRQIPAGDNIT